MQRSIGIPLLGLWLGAATAFAAPGDPFGGDDAGCVPIHKGALRCGGIVAKALAHLHQHVTACHLKHATQAFQAGHSSPGFDHAEENCTDGPAATSARAKFDAVLAKYAPLCDAGLLADAEVRRDTLLDDQTNPESLDALNGEIFCDATSGLTIAEPGGDVGGWIPADKHGLMCAARVAKAHVKLVVSVHKCHLAAAKIAFKGAPFDDDACEQAAEAKYAAVMQKLTALGVCPTCLVAAAPGLGAGAVADLDTQLGEIFPCPAPLTAAPCNDLGGGQCSDLCATPGYECVFVPTGYELTGVPGFPEIHGQDDCRCVPAALRCENLSAAVCAATGANGLCATAAEQCADTGGGACACQ